MERRRVLAVAALLAACTLAVLLWARPSSGPLHLERLARRPLRPGAEILEARLVRSGSEAGRLYGVVFEVGALEPEIALNTASRTLHELFPDAPVVANGGFFTPERRPTGLLVSAGKTLSAFVAQAGAAGSGIFVLRGGKAELLRRADVAQAGLPSCDFAIQAGPRLIEPDGSAGILSDDGVRANRTVLGIDGKGRVLLLVIVGAEGWSSGPTLHETMRLLGAEGLGRLDPALAVSAALNLDGGPSTGMHVKSDPPIHAPETSPVLSIITLAEPGG